MASLSTLRGQVNLQDALDEDDDVLAQLRYPGQQKAFWDSLVARKADIEALVRYHLGIDWCYVCTTEIWKAGSFNVVLPVLVRAKGCRGNERVYVRFPLPYKLGEAQHPGNVEEKLRTEIATYTWLQEHCSDVPIPVLHGFGLPDGTCFSYPQNTPFLRKVLWGLRRKLLAMFGFPIPSHYVRRGLRNPFDSGYMILSEAKGRTLAVSWEKHRHDKAYRQRLFRDLARICLSMNRTPLPRIGALRFNSNGVVTLSNRPLNMYFQMLENEGIPSGIPQQRTYSSVEPYISDLLSFQDNKLLYQPNSIHDQADGEMQLAALAALRATMHRFIRTEDRDGPFYYTLTDLQQNNIFVDEQWNIQSIIDLEWAQSQPIEMQLPPYWVTSKPIDAFDDAESVSELGDLFNEYINIYQAEEMASNGVLIHSPVMRHVWETGSFWYFHAIKVPKGMHRVFNSNIQPLFNEEHCHESIFDRVFFWYWGSGAQELIEKKIQDKEKYAERIKETFGIGPVEHKDASLNVLCH
ncbi:hypothetical protein CONLIGDRAFT_628013 [Coniochaeta ligniaria NRRL 30616]|uniref:Aminoglycoside phosphotransferase domain-containing protein n=1 Tax=Coniochaeta ligniaria NRRL 30616 TaxID=1408157 RepID=A0A1J7J116_9PEZI|nr:hypothetical protein CONLIGDRAFT_628013 [Coniochaeta ligniaria NRRL 30616]